MFKPFPHYRQHDAMDCGPTCLQMIARYYGKRYSLQTLRERSFITREGVSMWAVLSLVKETRGTAKVIIRERTLLECFFRRSR